MGCERKREKEKKMKIENEREREREREGKREEERKRENSVTMRGRAADDLKTRRSRRRRLEVVTTTGVTDDRERHDSPRRPGPTHASSPPRAQPYFPRDGHPLACSQPSAFFPLSRSALLFCRTTDSRHGRSPVSLCREGESELAQCDDDNPCIKSTLA